jgi:putative restriction endonuclease
MREVAPGDIVFSFNRTRIRAIGIAESFCHECPKPAEFGAAGPNWANVGWKIDVRFALVPNPLRPADRMDVLAPLLTERYAPLRANGHGFQSIYLTALEPAFAAALLALMGPEAPALANDSRVRDRPFEESRAPGQGQTECAHGFSSVSGDLPKVFRVLLARPPTEISAAIS